MDDIDPADIAILVLERIRRRVRTHPVSTMAAAAGVGYVLGGGIPDFVLRWGAAAAVRVISAQVLAQMISGGVEERFIDMNGRATQRQ